MPKDNTVLAGDIATRRSIAIGIRTQTLRTVADLMDDQLTQTDPNKMQQYSEMLARVSMDLWAMAVTDALHRGGTIYN